MDDHATLGYSRSVTASDSQASDSPRIAVIEARRYRPLLPMRYDDDHNDFISSEPVETETSNLVGLLVVCG